MAWAKVPFNFHEQVIKLYEEMHTIKEIASIFNCDQGRISRLLKKHNVKIRTTIDYNNKKFTNRINFFNEDFFNEIDNEHKAYWLGFLYADGYVYLGKNKQNKIKGGQVQVGLKSTDDYHLYNFLKCLNHNNIKIYYKNIKLNNKIYKSANINLGSKKMAQDLNKQGCTQAKSLTLEFPKKISHDLLKHFIRGYFDGDGHIGFYNKKSISCNLLGTESFLNSLKKFLNNSGINSGKITKEKSQAYRMCISGRDNLVLFYNLLYSESSVFLERKKEKFIEIFLEFNKDFAIGKLAKKSLSLED